MNETRKVGRPRKYEGGAARYTIVLDPSAKAEVETFARWFQYTNNRTVGISEILLEILRRSPEFGAFKKAALEILRQSPEFETFQKAALVATKPEPSREGVFLEHSLPEPSREGMNPIHTQPTKAMPLKHALPEAFDRIKVFEPFAQEGSLSGKRPSQPLQAVTTKPEPEPSPVPVVTLRAAPEQAEGRVSGTPPPPEEEDPSAALRAALKTLGTSGSEVAKKAGMSKATFTRFMKGGQVPGFTVDRLQAAMKETKP